MVLQDLICDYGTYWISQNKIGYIVYKDNKDKGYSEEIATCYDFETAKTLVEKLKSEG